MPMLDRIQNRIILIVLCLSLLYFPVRGVQGADPNISPETTDIPTRIRENIWTLLSFMTERTEGLRAAAPVILGPNRYAAAEASVKHLDSSWPQDLVIKFFEGAPPKGRLVEQIIDHGLNGLEDHANGDSYLRYPADGGPTNLLQALDPQLGNPINEEYLERLRELIGVLGKDPRVHEKVVWSQAGAGLEWAEVETRRYIRLGPNRMIFVRLDPALYDLVPFSRKEMPGEQPMNVLGWAKILPQARILLNAGQYYPDLTYMGVLTKDGVNFGSKLHPNWMAILLSGGPIGRADLRPSRILDQKDQDLSAVSGEYRYSIQSFMLLDRDGNPRVRQSERLASRTIVAEDGCGRMLIAYVPGACTLYELALFLKQSDLDIKQAMCLDGGFEAQLLIAGHTPQAFFGAWVVNERKQFHYPGGLRVPLPAVIAVLPKEAAP